MRTILCFLILSSLFSCNSVPIRENSGGIDTFTQKEAIKERIDHKTFSRPYTLKKTLSNGSVDISKHRQNFRIGLSSHVKSSLKSSSEENLLYKDILNHIKSNNPTKCIRVSRSPFKDLENIYLINTYKEIGSKKDECDKPYKNTVFEVNKNLPTQLLRNKIVKEILDII